MCTLLISSKDGRSLPNQMLMFQEKHNTIPLLTNKVLFLKNECKEDGCWLVCMETGVEVMVNMTLRTEIGQRMATKS